MFIFQMAKTLAKREEKNAMFYLITTAITCLFLTILAGFLLVWNFAFGGILSHASILYSHVTLGVAGWFTLLIFSFSYKLVPMFSLSHGFSMKGAKPAYFTYVLGLILLILSFWINAPIIQTVSWLILFISFGFFVLDMKEILKKRLKKKLDKPFRFALIAIVNGLIIHFVAFIFSLFGIHNPSVWAWLIFLYIMCWVIFSILGYLYKIVPFLWWTHKYSERIGKEKVPTLKDMIDEKLSVILFSFMYIALAGIIISVVFQSGITVFIFLGILAITSFIYTLSIIKVLVK